MGCPARTHPAPAGAMGRAHPGRSEGAGLQRLLLRALSPHAPCGRHPPGGRALRVWRVRGGETRRACLPRRFPEPAPTALPSAPPAPPRAARARGGAHPGRSQRARVFRLPAGALSLRTTFDADTAGEVELHLWFVIGEEILDARIQRGDFQIQRLPQSSDPPPPSRDRPPRIDSDPKTLAAIIHAGLPPAEAADQGALRVEGSPDVL